MRKGAAIKIEPQVNEVVSALQQVSQMSDADLLKMGQNGLALVREQFVWPKVAAEMRQVYNWMVGGGPRPGCVQ
jgi:poly(glycerol-phosphate) alpha-glucosyltransferase